LALAVVGALAVGCGGGDETSLEEEIGFDEEGILERQVQVEQFTRACMQAEGFDYVPVDPEAQRAAIVGSEDLSEEDFEKQYGYGITTLFEQSRNVPSNPNTAIRAALPPTEQLAYDRALYGENTDATFAVAIDTGEVDRLGGCTRTATEQAFGGAEQFNSLMTKIEDLEARVAADPRMATAISNWSSCMREAGWDGLTDPEQVDSTLLRKLEEIVGDPGAPGPRADYDRTALTALQREEVAMVAADISCERRHIEKVEDDVLAEYEEEFREQNVDLLAKISLS
jgi:hypothetical protein